MAEHDCWDSSFQIRRFQSCLSYIINVIRFFTMAIRAYPWECEGETRTNTVNYTQRGLMINLNSISLSYLLKAGLDQNINLKVKFWTLFPFLILKHSKDNDKRRHFFPLSLCLNATLLTCLPLTPSMLNIPLPPLCLPKLSTLSPDERLSEIQHAVEVLMVSLSRSYMCHASATE